MMIKDEELSLLLGDPAINTYPMMLIKLCFTLS